jgi:hypothetical protein
MASFCDVATFILDRLERKEAVSLSLVNSQVLNGAPTSYVSTSVTNRVPKRLKGFNGKLWDFVEKLKVKKPNLHTLNSSLQDLSINSLTLEWTNPLVRSTSLPPPINLQVLAPNLGYLTLKENGTADHSLPFFQDVQLPKRLRLLDLSGLHLPSDESKFLPVILAARNVKCRFCKCCSIMTHPVWEKNWSEVDHV